MPSIKRILFPVDFSERASGAARYVESIAGRFDAEIMLLHVIDASHLGAFAQNLHSDRQEQLQRFMAEDFKPFSTRRVCVLGDPAEEILNVARAWEPNLVMMPSYGLGFYRPGLIGSVTAKVLHDVTYPIWTSPHAEEAPVLERIAYNKVLCAVDLGERSAQVVEWAASFAGDCNAEFAVVNATTLMEAPPLVAHARERIGALLAGAGAQGAVLVSGGEPSKTVSCAAKEFRADLVVIGRYSVAADDGYLHHNAYGIIRESPCPVISI